MSHITFYCRTIFVTVPLTVALFASFTYAAEGSKFESWPRKAFCEARLRNIPVPDVDTILSWLPVFERPSRLKADPDKFISLLKWSADYDSFRHRQINADNRDELEGVKSYMYFFYLLTQTPEGKKYAEVLSRRPRFFSARQKNLPLKLSSAVYEFQDDVENTLKKTGELLASTLNVAEQRRLIATLFELMLKAKTYRGGYRDMPGSWNPMTFPVDEAVDAMADFNLQPRYSYSRRNYDAYDDPFSYTLDPGRFLTSYNDYVRIFAALNLKPGQKLVEIGSAFGRGALAFGVMAPQGSYVGYEIVEERFRQAERMADSFGLENVKFFKKDIFKSKIECADYYFMFNPKEFDALTGLEDQLRECARQRPVMVIRGRETPLPADQKKWLKSVTLDDPWATNRKFEMFRVVP